MNQILNVGFEELSQTGHTRQALLYNMDVHQILAQTKKDLQEAKELTKTSYMIQTLGPNHSIKLKVETLKEINRGEKRHLAKIALKGRNSVLAYVDCDKRIGSCRFQLLGEVP